MNTTRWFETTNKACKKQQRPRENKNPSCSAAANPKKREGNACTQTDRQTRQLALTRRRDLRAVRLGEDDQSVGGNGIIDELFGVDLLRFHGRKRSLQQQQYKQQQKHGDGSREIGNALGNNIHVCTASNFSSTITRSIAAKSATTKTTTAQQQDGIPHPLETLSLRTLSLNLRFRVHTSARRVWDSIITDPAF